MSATELKQWIEARVILTTNTEWRDLVLQELNQGEPLEEAPYILVKYAETLLAGMAGDEAQSLLELLVVLGGDTLVDQANVYGAVQLLRGYVIGIQTRTQ